MRTVKFTRTVIGADGPLKEGETHSLNDASADRWIKRGAATIAVAEEKPEPAQKGDPADEAKPAKSVPIPAQKVTAKAKA